MALVVLLAGCASTPKVNWDSRVGRYTFDQAVLDLGPPDKSAQLTDGAVVAEWMTQRGYNHGTYYYLPGSWAQAYQDPPTPDYFLRLTFGADGKLTAWKRVVK